MEEDCEECEQWEEHQYWDHVDAKGKMFYRVMMDDFTHSMKIPKKFIDHLSGELSETVHLKDPSGIIWHAELVKTTDGAFLQAGWKGFAQAHHLQENDLLIFKYDGNSCFKIKMLEASGCEKANSYCLKIKESLKQESNGNEDSGEPHHAETVCSSDDSHDDMVRNKPPSTSQKTSRIQKEAESNPKTRSRGRNRVFTSNELDGRAKDLPEGTSKKVDAGEDANYHIKQENDQRDSDKLTDRNICMLRKAQLSAEGEKIARRLAQTVSSGNPYFIAVINPGNLGKRPTLTVPSEFRVHLPCENRRIFLQVAGKREKLAVTYFCNEAAARISGNWIHFVSENNLQEGDICLFELISSHKDDIVMRVGISRAADHGSCLKETHCFF